MSSFPPVSHRMIVAALGPSVDGAKAETPEPKVETGVAVGPVGQTGQVQPTSDKPKIEKAWNPGA
jgi:hypothetical protein